MVIWVMMSLGFMGMTTATKISCDFVWGTATASYQVEGAWNVDGRGESIWDTFSHTPGNVRNDDNGDEACQQYFKYEEDVQLMKSIGLDAYRFSFSWPRLFPNGTGLINEAGVAYYNRLIDNLLANDITPMATLYHWDLPEALQQRYLGWLSPFVQDDFVAYANLCFSRFGDRVKHWITFNEPQVFTVVGHGDGVHAPGRCSDRSRCAQGDSSREPYVTAHNVLISHAKAVNLYRTQFAYQGGVIGITIDGDYSEPWTLEDGDIQAAERRQEFQHGWYFDPIYFGDYPPVMRQHVGARLPQFTEEERQLLIGSTDFAGLNQYTSRWVGDAPPCNPCESIYDDMWVNVTTERNGEVIGPRAASEWLYVVPRGIRGVINWVANRYGNPPIYITENGRDNIYDPADPIEVTIDDYERIEFYEGYIDNVLLSIQDGANVRGYFAWSLLDNFEWAEGYHNRFGLTYVNFTDPNKQRIPRRSVAWYRDFISKNKDNCVA